MIISNNKKVNLGYIFFGFFATFFGLLMLANAFNIIVFNINFLHLLPILIISIGLSFLDTKSLVSVFEVLCVILVTMTAIIASLVTSFSVVASSYPLRILKDANIKEANITINVIAGSINISKTNVEGVMVSGDAGEDYEKIKSVSKTIGEVQDIEIDFNGVEKILTSELKNHLSLEMASDIPVNIYLTAAASNSNIDLDDINVKKIVISAGASNINLNVGDKADISEINIETGTSSISINLPNTIGANLKVNSIISSDNIIGFTVVSENRYQSDNYEAVDKKVNLDVKIGMGNLFVNWYEPDRQLRDIQLFYYQQSKDEDVSCDEEFVIPISRQISESDNMIRDAINLLIKGQLTEQEKTEGFTTEFPRKDFKLINTDLVDGNLTLTFTEVSGFTTGGSCRVGLLSQQIIKTASQFPGVDRVLFYPDSLFQP